MIICNTVQQGVPATWFKWNLFSFSLEGEARRWLLTVKIRQPSHEFTFGVGISFIPYPLVLTLVVQQVHLCMSVLEFSVYAGF
jgi:hypothetical protein